MSKKHMLIMLACCLIPLVGLGLIFLFHVPTNNIVLFGMILICPLAHILMLKFMGSEHDQKGPSGIHMHEENPSLNPNTRQ